MRKYKDLNNLQKLKKKIELRQASGWFVIYLEGIKIYS